MPRPRRRPSAAPDAAQPVPADASTPTPPDAPVAAESGPALAASTEAAPPESSSTPETPVAPAGDATDNAPPVEAVPQTVAAASPDASPAAPASESASAEPAASDSPAAVEVDAAALALGEAPAPAGTPAPGGPLQLKLILESLLFSAQKALTPRELREYLVTAAQDETAPEAAAFKKVKDPDIEEALRELQREHEVAGRTYRLLCVAGSWQFATVPEYAPWLRALLGRKARPPRLSQPGIETLTIIAYRQPVTRAEIEQIRGVNIDGVMQTLLERGLVVAVGRAEVVGRPVTYGTTPQFLEYFGIRALEDLPAADELRRIPVQRPESLLTVDPNLATAPADAPAPAPAPAPEAPAPTPAPPAEPSTPA